MWKQHTHYQQTTEPHACNCTFRSSSEFVVKIAFSFTDCWERCNFKARKLYLTYLKRFFQGFSGNTLYLCKTAQGLEASWQNRLGKTVSESYSFHLISFYFPLTLFSWNFHFTTMVTGYIWQSQSPHGSFTAMHTKEWVAWRQIICMKTQICRDASYTSLGYGSLNSREWFFLNQD